MFPDVDEGAVIVLKYKSGAMANLTYHTNAGKGKNVATITGTKGRIEVRMVSYQFFVYVLVPVYCVY